MNEANKRHSPRYNPTSIDAVKTLYDMLRGSSLPETIAGKSPLNLTHKKAFFIIWFLQEHMGILPDHFEKCDNCKALYDSEKEGSYSEKTGKFSCGGCL